MSPSMPTMRLMLAALVCLGLIVACSLPLPGSPATEEEAAPDEPAAATDETPPEEGVSGEPLVVTQRGEIFNIYALDGTLVESRPATGLGYARPNTAQVVGDTVYYVDSGGAGLGGVIRRVTAAGATSLDFTTADPMASLTFAVSLDESRIAWTHSAWGATGVTSQLFIANLDGSQTQLVAQSDPADELAEYYALEAMRWTAGGDLIYSWQVTGIGGYILFFGWSSFYRYSPASGASTPLVAAGAEGTGPCWYTLSPDEAYAVGGCGIDGLLERELGSGAETVFPVLPDQGQQGAAAYSPSGARLAYAVARGDSENEAGQVVVRSSRGEAPAVIASHSPGYFDAMRWVDETRLVAAYTIGEASAVDLLNLDGTRRRIGDGRLIGLMQPVAAVSSAASLAGLPGQIDREELTVVDITSTGDIAGPGVRVTVHNPGPSEIETIIPCGFVFMPGSAGDQRLMVVQPVSATIPPGGQATLTAFTICIDPSSAAPADGAGYTLGGMESGDLLTLARCACQEDLGGETAFMAGMEVMLAGWTIRNGLSFENEIDEEATGAMDQFFGQGSGQEMVEALEAIGDLGGEWLDRCGIEVP